LHLFSLSQSGRLLVELFVHVQHLSDAAVLICVLQNSAPRPDYLLLQDVGMFLGFDGLWQQLAFHESDAQLFGQF
jgi:hypothetical protein